MYGAHLLVAGEEHERPAAAGLEHAHDLVGGIAYKGRMTRVGQVLRHVEGGLVGVVEVPGDDQRARRFQAQPPARVVEVAGHRQGRRGQHHGVDGVEELLGDNAGNVDGRGLQERAATAPLDPVDEAAVVARHPHFEILGQRHRAVEQREDFFGRVLDEVQVGRDQLQAVQHVAILFGIALQELLVLAETAAALVAGEQSEEARGGLAHRDQDAVQFLGGEPLAPRDCADVPLQFLELVVAHRNAEVLAHHVFDLVGLVEHHRAVFGDDAGELPLLHGQVGEEEVVVDDDDVALMRALVHAGEEAALELRALLAGAHLAPRVHLGPRRGAFGQGPDLGAVAGFGGLLPLADDLEIGHFFETFEDRLLPGVVDLLAAGVVVPSLHVADGQVAAQVLLEERHVLVEELLLQVLGAGGDDHALAGEDGGDQVGERLAGAGAGLDDEMPPLGQRGLDRLGHLKLPGPELETRMATRKQSRAREELAHRELAGPGHPSPV